MEQLEQLTLQGNASKTRLRQERLDELHQKIYIIICGEIKNLVDKMY